MDGITLDALIAEARPLLVGQHVDRVALGGPEALLIEIAGRSRLCLRLDASRATSGIYLLSRDEGRTLRVSPSDRRGGGANHALLLFRKHLEGKRVESLARVAGARVVSVGVPGGVLVLRLSTPAPGLTLALAQTPVASLGSGPPAFPAPEPAPEREWARVDEAALEEAAREGLRAVLDLCPSLGPILARSLVEGGESVASLRRRLANPRPTVVVTSAPVAEVTDAQLAEPGSVLLLPFFPDPPAFAASLESARDAARLFLECRRRGTVFAESRRALVDAARREHRRLTVLEANLGGDLAGLPEEGTLRRSAEALLAAPSGSVDRGSSSVRVPDPQAIGQLLTVAVNDALSLPANADRLFAKARRIRKAREQIAARLLALRPALEEARSRWERTLSATNLSDLEEPNPPDRGRTPSARGARGEATEPSRPRHYLSSGGLSIRVGRGARENHELTFGLARPEDYWLHARDVPGAHVILQDVGGRAGPEDLREAAELAAFFSEARGESGVDVHVTRRKHVRPGGGAGRVRVGHSDTIRVAPRDPGGRLRER